MEKVLIHSQVSQGTQPYTPVNKTWEGREYIVVPVVMMVEGVHNGSRGPILHKADELEKSVPKWEGMPVTISHPQVAGNFVSANSEQILNDWGVGHVRNAAMDGTKLKAEAWLDVQKLLALSPETLAAVQSGQIIEVSVGVFSAEDEQPGIWNNEEYTSTSSNYIPDHLALLPGEVGACSVMDGCGVRVNKTAKKEGGENVDVNIEKVNRAIELNFGFIPMVNAEGLRETIEKVRESLYKKDSKTAEYYLEEVYADHAIYTKVDYVMEDENNGSRRRTGEYLYKQTYTIQEDGQVVWGGQPQKVVRKISYINVNEEVSKMCEPCKEKVNALIANANTHYTESDRTWLEGLPEDKLDKMIPKVVTVNVDSPVTTEKALEVLGIAKEQYEKGLEIYNNRRKEVITNIIANTEQGVWTEEVLNTMKLDVLEKLEKTATTKKAGTVYVGGGAGVSVGQATIAPMPLPGIEFEQK